MATASLPSLEATVLERVVQSAFADLPGEFARRLAAIELPAEDVERMRSLGAKARGGSLTDEEDHELEAYLRLGHMLNILRLQARSQLRKPSKKGNGRGAHGRKP